MSSAADEQNADQAGNRLRLLVAVLVALEAALLVAVGAFLIVAALASDQENPAALIALAVLALIVGVGLGACARGVTRGLRWTRGPVVTWQLLQAGVGMPVSTSNAWWAGVPLLAAAVVVGVLMAGRHVVREASEGL